MNSLKEEYLKYLNGETDQMPPEPNAHNCNDALSAKYLYEMCKRKEMEEIGLTTENGIIMDTWEE